MNYRFKAPLFPEWTFIDNVITIANKTIHLDEVIKGTYTPCKGRFKNGVIQIWTGPNKFFTLPFPYKQKEDGDLVANHIISYIEKKGK